MFLQIFKKASFTAFALWAIAAMVLVGSGQAFAASPNLILNPSLETASGSLPTSWQKGGFGTNNAVFTYPVAGVDGANAVKVAMTTRSSGDAKWFFNDVAVTAGKSYTFSDQYKSTVQTKVVARYTSSSNVLSYINLPNAASSAGQWATYSTTFTVPAGVTKMTVFHLLNAVGELTTDAYSLSENIVAPTDTTAPSVTLTAPTAGSTVSNTVALTATATDNVAVTGVQFIIDGVNLGAELTTSPYTKTWDTKTVANGTHTVAVKARDAANNSTTTTPISVTVSNVVSDTTAPTVALTAPAAGATVSNTVTLSATASDNVAVTGVQFILDGATNLGSELTTAPYTFAWDSKTVANGSHTIAVKARDAANNSKTTTPITVTVTNTVADTTAPTVALTAPAANASVTGTVPLTATATDNVAVTGVQFIVDGVNFGSELTTAPYSQNWDTTAVTNGAHTVSVKARDAANNTTTTTPITVTVANVITPPATNLIANHSLETASGALPANWQKGSWGTNNAVFTYPVAGIDGTKAAKVAMTTYSSGDAKWFFDDVIITPGKNYIFSDQYKSTAPTTVIARYTYADASVTYFGYASLPSSGGVWKTYSHEFTAPVGATKVTVFHTLGAVGELTVDNFAMGDQSDNTSALFSQGIVSFTFDDGWTSHFDTVRPILNAAGVKGSFYIITNPMNEVVEPNKVLNSGLETDNGDGTPTNWHKSAWGTNSAIFTYPTTGKTGNGAKVAITTYTDGDAKWYFDDAAIVSNAQYRFRNAYKSTTPTTITARFTMADASIVYRDLVVLPSSANAWAIVDIPFTAPANVQSVTIFHHISSIGELTIDDASLTLYAIYLTPPQVQQLQAEGHEVSSHTKTHPDLTTLTIPQATDEITASRTALQNIGITPLNTFVYPYGATNASLEQVVKNAGYLAARTVEPGYNTKATNRYALRVQNVGVGTTLDDVKGWVTTALADHTWLILVFHQVDLSADAYGTTPALFQQMVDYVKTQPIQIRTMDSVQLELNP